MRGRTTARRVYTAAEIEAQQHVDEGPVQRAIISGLSSIPGCVVFDPPPAARGSSARARALFRRLFEAAIARFEQRPWGAFVWRRNVGGAYLPGGAKGRRPVFYGLPGEHDLAGVLKPSGRWWCTEVKPPGRSVLKDGSPGAYLTRMSPEQRLWVRLLAGAGAVVSEDPAREATVAIDSMRALLVEEQARAKERENG